MSTSKYDLDAGVVDHIRDLLDGCRSRDDVDGKKWNAARLSITGLFRTESARQVTADQFDRITPSSAGHVPSPSMRTSRGVSETSSVSFSTSCCTSAGTDPASPQRAPAGGHT